MPADTVSSCMETLAMLTRSKKKLSIDDIRLDWRPVYNILSRDLFLRRRQYEYRYARVLFLYIILKEDSQLSYNMAYVAENTRKFFSPACIDEMLQEFVPHIIGSNLDVCISFKSLFWYSDTPFVAYSCKPVLSCYISPSLTPSILPPHDVSSLGSSEQLLL